MKTRTTVKQVNASFSVYTCLLVVIDILRCCESDGLRHVLVCRLCILEGRLLRTMLTDTYTNIEITASKLTIIYFGLSDVIFILPTDYISCFIVHHSQ